MSSGTETPLRSTQPPYQPGADRHEDFIEDRLRQTRRQVKGVDLAGGLLVMAIGTLAYLLAVAVIDHWLVSGGLGFWGRLLLFGGLVGAGGYYLVHRVLPPLMWRINPVFAAHTIEQSRPSLKNSLINFLLLRGQRREVSPVVYQAVQHRAAADLSQVPAELAVDRAPVIRLGYLLIVVLTVCCLYLVFSPKNPLISAARILWPWAAIKAPSRVTIEEVEPGDVVAFHGDEVTVTARVGGLKDGEPVVLFYTTDDGESIDQAVPMTPPGERGLHQCKLPPSDRGLQEDGEYYLAAGDCITERFQIDVRIAPTILVDAVEYDYPAYTGIADRTVERQGDVRGIEGTRVTIRARANRPIGWAEIDLDCDGQRGLQMEPHGESAVGRFTLRLDPDDAMAPEHDSYQLRFSDPDGELSRRPIRHRIDVIRDLPPEVEVVDPPEEEVALPQDGQLEIRLRAVDPDFALTKVLVRARVAERDVNLNLPAMLDASKKEGDRPHEGEFSGMQLFVPARLGLMVGDRVRYWAEAEDNKEPQAGRSETAPRWITIVEPQNTQQPAGRPNGDQRESQQPSPNEQDRQPRDDQQPGQTGEGQPSQQEPAPDDAEGQHPADSQAAPDENPQQPNQDASKQPQDGQQDGQQPGEGSGQPEPGAGGEAQDGQGDAPQEPIDGETNPGDAMEEILRHREESQREQQQQPGEEGQNGASQQPDGAQQQPGGQKTPGQQQQERAGGENQPGDGQGDAGQPQPNGQTTPSGQQQGGGEGQSTSPEPSEGPGQPSGARDDADQEPPGSPQRREPAGGEGPSQDSQQPGGTQPPRAGQPDGGQQQPGGQKPPAGQQQREQGGGEGQQRGPEQTERPGQPRGQQQDTDQNRGPGREQPGGAKGTPGEQTDEAQSPHPSGTSPKPSDAQHDTEGDRSGGGEKTGSEEAETPGDEASDSPTEQPGAPDAGKARDDQIQGDHPGRQSARPEDGAGTGERSQPPEGEGPSDSAKPPGDFPADGGNQTDAPSDGTPKERRADGPATRGNGRPSGGGPGETPDATPPDDPESPGGDDPNLKYAAEQTDLALEHLRDQMKEEDSDLLRRLGWSPEEARKFLQRWEQMKRMAGQKSARGKDAAEKLDQALKSLGLRPRGAELRAGGPRLDQLQNLRESGRFDPPAHWAEKVREYYQGVAGRRE